MSRFYNANRRFQDPYASAECDLCGASVMIMRRERPRRGLVLCTDCARPYPAASGEQIYVYSPEQERSERNY